MAYTPPSHDCPLCPRLAAFRDDNQIQYPSFFNGPVPSFGNLNARLLVVGLAPGLKGANQTGRPFTGDYAGLVLYSSLKKYGFAEGIYDPQKVSGASFQVSAPTPDTRYPTPHTDGFHLIDCRITNSVRCVPPANKPEPSEIKQCNKFLESEIKAMPNLQVILTLGLIAHKALLMGFGFKQSAYPFGHGNQHELHIAGQKLQLFNSYHCSRYNINTGTLTQTMFDEIVLNIKNILTQ